MVGGMMVTFITSGRLITRTGRYKVFPVAGSAVLTVGLLLLSRLGPHTTLAVASVYMFVVGLGIGLMMQVLVVAVQNAVPYSRLGVATSTASFFRSIGGAFGVSALGAVFSSRLLHDLSQHASKAQLSLLKGGGIAANPAQINHLPPAQRSLFVEAFSHSLQAVFLVAVPFTVLAFVLSILMKEIPLRTTSQVAQATAESPDDDMSEVDMPDDDGTDADGKGADGTLAGTPVTGTSGVAETVGLVVGFPDL
jgi:MFS family permease